MNRPGPATRRYFDHDEGCVLDLGHHPAPCLQGGIGKAEQLWDCKRCEDSGWVDCDTPWCTDDSHGGICDVPVWIGPRIQQAMEALGDVQVLCFPCGAQADPSGLVNLGNPYKPRARQP